MPLLRPVFFMFSLGLVAVATARAGFSGGYEPTNGSDRYRKGEWRAALSLPWKGPELQDDPVYHLDYRETRLKRRGVEPPTLTRGIRFHMDYFRQIKVGGHFWRTYVTAETLGGYRANGGGAFAAVRGNGWIPLADVTEDFAPGPVYSEWTFSWSQSARYEHVLFPGNVPVWKKLEDDAYGLSLEETLRRNTVARLGWTRHVYDQNVPDLIKSGRYFFLGRVQAVEEPEWMHGFPRDVFSLGLERSFAGVVRLSGGWERFSYEAGFSSKADKYTAEGGITLWKAVTLGGRYQSFRPRDGRKTEYRGGSLSVSF